MLTQEKPAEIPFFPRRVTVLFGLFLIAIVVIALKIYLLAVVKGKHYYELSEDNFLQPVPLVAPRGIIYDQNGNPLATNETTYNLYITPYKLTPEAIHESLAHLSELLNEDFTVFEGRVLAITPKWERLCLKTHLPLREVIPILENVPSLSGVSLEEGFKRFYPYGRAFSHVLGYIGKISPGTLDFYLEQKYDPSIDLVGKTGVEKQYERYLAGRKGRQIIHRDARGKPLRQPYEDLASEPGNTVFLTLDITLQMEAYEAMKDSSGVVLAIHPGDGAIRAMVSVPDFDPHDPSAPENTYFINKAFQEQYAPGSIFKVITALAALEKGIGSQRRYVCGGEFFLGGYSKPYTCFRKKVHGGVDLRDALKVSCNIYFYQLSRDTGIMNLLRTGARMGLGFPAGIDLPGEVPGIFPVHQPDSFTLGETISLGIGQGRLSITPLQMANVYCAVANKGTIYVPHVLDRIEDREGKVIRRFEPRLLIDTGIPEHNFRPVFEGLVRVVSEEGGTAHRAGFPPEWKVAGKTGTAERGKGLKTNALFACISPYDAPELVVLVVVEGGGTGGEAAAPIARRILEKFYSNDLESP